MYLDMGFLDAMRMELLPAGPPRTNTVVKKAIEQPDYEPLVSITGALGKDFDFDKYFKLI